MICGNCGFPVHGYPIRANGRVYCCAQCMHGGPCDCNYGRQAASETTQTQWLAPPAPGRADLIGGRSAASDLAESLDLETNQTQVTEDADG